MLTPEQLAMIPSSTRSRWDGYRHDDYFGFEMVEDYIDSFDYIQQVLVSKHIKQGLRFMCTLRTGYKSIISEIEGNKKMMRNHADKITFAIERFARKSKINKTDVCSIFGVSRDWFYRHREKKVCTKSKLEKCYRQYPNQLTFDEVEQIERIVNHPENKRKTKTTLFYESIKNGLVICALSTFFKYADLCGYKKIKKKENDKHPIGYRATHPFECLHIDVTHVQTKNDGLQYVAFVKDNFSGALLHVKSTSKYADSKFIRDLCEEAFIKYHLHDATDQINILSDGGPENKGSLLEWINQISAPPVVKKITANSSDFPFSNSMSEITHSIYKTEFMQKKFSLDTTEHLKHLEEFMEYYNYNRYLGRHLGLTPMEVLNGEMPDKNRYTEIIRGAKIKRIEENRLFNNCPLVCI